MEQPVKGEKTMSFLKRLFGSGKTQSPNRTQARQESPAQTPLPPERLQAIATSPQQMPQKESAKPFADNGDGTVTDKKTGLMWQKSDDGQKRNWHEATEYAKSMLLAGHSDWRLPSKDELISLSSNIRPNTEIRKTYFPGIKSSDYWTSTTYENNEGDAYYVTCDGGNPYSGKVSSSYSYKTGSFYVCCVRALRETAAAPTNPAPPKPVPTKPASPPTLLQQMPATPSQPQSTPSLTADLITAATRGDVAAVQALLGRGADVNGKGPKGETALVVASQEGRRDVVQALLDKGADVNAKTNNNNVTALMLASANGYREVVQMLLDKGADINAKASGGKTALDAATAQGHVEVRALLVQAVSSRPPAKPSQSAPPPEAPVLVARPEPTLNHVEEAKDIIRNSSGAHNFLSRATQAGWVKIKEDFIGIYLKKGDATLIFGVLPSKGPDTIWNAMMTTKDTGTIYLISEGKIVV
jgi:hypothetical protein